MWEEVYRSMGSIEVMEQGGLGGLFSFFLFLFSHFYNTFWCSTNTRMGSCAMTNTTDTWHRYIAIPSSFFSLLIFLIAPPQPWRGRWNGHVNAGRWTGWAATGESPTYLFFSFSSLPQLENTTRTPEHAPPRWKQPSTAPICVDNARRSPTQVCTSPLVFPSHHSFRLWMRETVRRSHRQTWCACHHRYVPHSFFFASFSPLPKVWKHRSTTETSDANATATMPQQGDSEDTVTMMVASGVVW